MLTAISRRTFATATLALSLGVHTGILPGYLLVYHPYYLWKIPPEVWRIVTAFLITGDGLSMLFDTYFLYQYLSQLELGNTRFPRKEDVLWYLMFVSGTILVGLDVLFHSIHICICLSASPSYICPGSALPLQLSRFLEMRKITPAFQLDPSFAKYLGLVCGVGMVGCLMDGSCDSQFTRVVF
jgi:hypothetical protein